VVLPARGRRGADSFIPSVEGRLCSRMQAPGEPHGDDYKVGLGATIFNPTMAARST
jgi:hypothetical protein